MSDNGAIWDWCWNMYIEYRAVINECLLTVVSLFFTSMTTKVSGLQRHPQRFLINGAVMNKCLDLDAAGKVQERIRGHSKQKL